MFLSETEFKNIVKSTPLFAIDLCIFKGRKILLGKRINSPAKDFFFVPGGRILKSELMRDAFSRILVQELGMHLRDGHDKFIKNLGLYEHFYEDNFLGNREFSTHYLVIAYLIQYDSLTEIKITNRYDQHSEFIWFPIDNIGKSNQPIIHEYTKAYLNNSLIQELTNV